MGFRDVAALGPIAPLLPSANGLGLETRPWAQELVHVTQGAISELYKTVSLITTELGDLLDGGSALPLHATTHLPNGTDPLATGIPVNVGLGPNAAGIANSFSRSDHVHALDQSANYHFTGTVTIDNLIAPTVVATPSYGGSSLIQNVDLAPNLAGLSLLAARADHHHTLDQDITPTWTSPHVWNTGIATEIPIKITMAAAQTAEPFRIEDSTGALVADILANGNIRFNTSGVVETSVPSNAKVLAVGPLVTGVTFPVGQYVAYDSQAYNTSDHGGGISFGGFYESTNSIFTTWAAIRACKTDNVSNNYGGFLAFHVRTNGSPDIAERARFIETGQFGIGLTAPTSLLHLRSTTGPQITVDYDSTHRSTVTVDIAGNLKLNVAGSGGAGNIFNLRDSVARSGSQLVFLLDSDDAAQSSPHYMKANNLGNFSFGYGNSGSVIDPIPGHVLSFLQQTHNRPSFSTQINDCGILAYVQYDDTTGTGTSVNGAACGVKAVVGLTSSLAGVPFAPIGVIGHFGYAACNFDDPSLGGHSLACFQGYFGGTIGSLDYQTRAPIDDVNTNGAIRGAFDHVSVFWANARTYGAGGTNPTNKPVISSSARLVIQGCATDEQWGVYGHSFNFTGTKQLCTTSGFIRIPFPGTNGATNRAHAYWLPTAAPAGGSVWVNAGGEYWDDGTNCAPGSYEFDGTSWFRRRTSYFTETADATIGNSTTETTVVGTGVGSVTLPAKLLVAGRTIRLTARGSYGTDAVAPTLRIKVKLIDSTPTTVVILDTGAVTLTAAQTNQYWELDALVTCRTTGATGTVFAQGLLTLSNGATTALHLEMSSGGTANANTATSTIDTTKTEKVEITATWGTANANNTITTTNLAVEVLN